jgi:protein-tyrosine phosphatase
MGFWSRLLGKHDGQGRALDREPLDLSVFQYDFHSHLVPGVDDGAPDLAASMEMIDALVSLGYQGAVTTPHVMADTYPNTPDTLSAPFAELQQAVAERHPQFELALGAEYFLDAGLLDTIQQGGPLLTPGGRLLFELAFSAPPDPGLLQGFIFEAQVRGFQPVLAHIERYPYWHQELHRFQALHEQGVWLQVNAASLAGTYGPEIQGAAETCIDNGWVQLLGTDAHGLRHIDALAAARMRPALHQLAGVHSNHLLFSA